ncbi:hypothetical protein [Geofilum rhodophaeum]|uniref:hypothetical protein n=1 Tax=Geofilum rhodophaeum TaxID=1965019 RepID=UPI000B520629|nr:hypothetical protein [Geofilum rhodophaeum]
MEKFDLSNIDRVIRKYNDWGKPWAFVDFVKTTLNDKEIEYFDSIMKIALEFENWNYSDLTLGCKITHTRLRKITEFSEKAVANIVRSASYEWK